MRSIPTDLAEFVDRLPKNIGLTVVRNKADLTGGSGAEVRSWARRLPHLPPRPRLGLPALREHLKGVHGLPGATPRGLYGPPPPPWTRWSAPAERLLVAKRTLEVYVAGELVKPRLRLAQESLSRITSEFSSDDLLGRIFSSFCIGK